MKDSGIAGVWIITNDKNNKIINEKKQQRNGSRMTQRVQNQSQD